jgi:hypothetical protein
MFLFTLGSKLALSPKAVLFHSGQNTTSTRPSPNTETVTRPTLISTFREFSKRGSSSSNSVLELLGLERLNSRGIERSAAVQRLERWELAATPVRAAFLFQKAPPKR